MSSGGATAETLGMFMSSTYTNTRERRLYRDADRAVLGGVCAGLADYFGLNLKVTRFLTVIAFLMALPFAVIAYLAAVCLIPAASYRGREVRVESGCCWARSGRRRSRRSRRMRERIDREYEAARERERPRPSVAEVRERYKSLDKRLAELERKVTSPRFQLQQEFRKL